MHVGKATQGEESTAHSFWYCYSTGIAELFALEPVNFSVEQISMQYLHIFFFGNGTLG